mgnify:CR=1 FL=1
MKILIIGSDGFIGSRLSAKLKAENFEISTISRKECNLLNLMELESISRRFSDINVIIHCAGVAGSKNLFTSKRIKDQNNRITENILKVFLKFRSHFIFLSSISVYDPHWDQEIKVLNPDCKSQYGLGKLFNERSIIKTIDSFDIFRLYPVYDKENLNNINSRFFLIKDRVKVFLYPYKDYYFCSMDTLYENIKKRLSVPGRRLHLIRDKDPVNIQEIKNTKGINLILPIMLRNIFYPLIFLTKLLSKDLNIKINKFFYPFQPESFYDLEVLENKK